MILFFLILLNYLFASTESLLFDYYNIETVVQIHNYENEDDMSCSNQNQSEDDCSLITKCHKSQKKACINNMNEYDTIEFATEPSTSDNTETMKTSLVNHDTNQVYNETTIENCKKSFCDYICSGNRFVLLIVVILVIFVVIFIVLVDLYRSSKK